MTVTEPGREAPWDLTFLRVGTLVTTGLTAVAAPVAGLLSGWDAALGVVGGALVVTGFFVVSGVAVAWAGRVAETLTLPVALLTFGLKAMVLFAVLGALPEEGWLDRRALAWTVVVGALVWSAAQARWVWARPIYYVAPPPAPGAPPQSPPRGHPPGPAR